MDRGKYLKTLRIEHGLTQREVADRIGVHLSSINKYENNSVDIPTGKIEKLAEIYGVTPGEIINAGSKPVDVFKTLKLTITRIQLDSGISDYQELPDELKGLLASAALEAVRAFYNSLTDK